MKVGIRELKSHLSAYIEQARKGETVVITDHGKVVAQLGPSLAVDPPSSIRHLVDTGRVIYRPPLRDLLPPIQVEPGGKSLSEYVAEQRG